MLTEGVLVAKQTSSENLIDNRNLRPGLRLLAEVVAREERHAQDFEIPRPCHIEVGGWQPRSIDTGSHARKSFATVSAGERGDIRDHRRRHAGGVRRLLLDLSEKTHRAICV